jgi:hypothetical protein
MAVKKSLRSLNWQIRKISYRWLPATLILHTRHMNEWLSYWLVGKLYGGL